MSFITQGKTNWKFLLIVIALVAIIGGGILTYQYWWLPKEEIKPSEIKLPEREAPKTETTRDWLDDLITEYTNTDFLKYTDYEFGFSFYYPNSWQLSREEGDVLLLGESTEITKYSGLRVEDSSAVLGNVAYYYDENTRQWMGDYDTDSPDLGIGVEPVEPIFYTLSDFPVFEGVRRWKTNIVAISDEKFLIINEGGGGFIALLDPFTQTITDPHKKVDEEMVRELFIEGLRRYKDRTRN